MIRMVPLSGARAMRLVVPLAFAVVVIFIGLLLCDYNACWMHPEVPWRDFPHAFRYGTAVSIRDFAEVFDVAYADGASRARFVSYLLQTLNEKFRVWLFQYVTPHPSLHLTWIFMLVLSPILLFGFLRDITRAPLAGWIGVTLFLASTGTLSLIAIILTPAKPLTTFFAILCLRIAARVDRDAGERRHHPAGVPPLYLLLLCVMFLSFCTDETAWFLYVAIPVLFPRIFTRSEWKTRAAALYGATLLVFLLFVLVVAPRLSVAFGYARFEFLKWTSGSLSSGTHGWHAGERSLWDSFHARNVLHNAARMIFCQVIFSRSLFIHERLTFDGRSLILDNGGVYGPWAVIYVAALCACAWYLVSGLSSERRRALLRYGFVLCLFILYQSALLARTKQVIHSSFYYGTLASVFLTIPLAMLLSSYREGIRGAICRVLLALIVAASLYNFTVINESWIFWVSQPPPFDEFMGDPRDTEAAARELAAWGPPNARVTRETVNKAWRARHDKEAFIRMKSELPPRAWWLYQECRYMK